MKYDTYLFDWDGTLTNSIPIWHRAIMESLGVAAMGMDKDEIAHNFLGGWSIVSPDTLRHMGVADAQVFSDNVMERALAYGIRETELHNGVREILQSMEEKDFSTALVTNNFREVIDHALEHHNLTSAFSIVIAREDAPPGKPDPAGVNKAIGHMHGARIEKNRAALVGDTKHDVDAGRAAGVKTIVYYPKEHEQYLSYTFVKSWEPDLIIREWDELWGL